MALQQDGGESNTTAAAAPPAGALGEGSREAEAALSDGRKRAAGKKRKSAARKVRANHLFLFL